MIRPVATEQTSTTPKKKPASRKAAPKKSARNSKAKTKKLTIWARVRRWAWRGVFGVIGLSLAWIALYAIVPVPTTPYMISEMRRVGPIKHDWVDIEDITPDMARSVVAAEDANFCLHWGFDIAAIRTAIEAGGQRGASTLTQQVVKNAFLWHGRSYTRKALEALITPVVEAIWSKRRIVEVYMNVAEFDEGVFGVGAAAQHYFDTTPDKLTAQQAALLAAILPAPQQRSASRPGAFTQRRATSIRDGAATIRADGRADCFQS